MKKIAIIETTKKERFSLDFINICEHLIDSNKQKFVFYRYRNYSFEIKNRIFDRISKSNESVREILLPRFWSSFFMFIHALFCADVIFVNGIRFFWFFPLLRLLSNRKIVLYVGRDNFDSRSTSKYMFPIIDSEKIAFNYSQYIVTNVESIKDYIAFKYRIKVVLIEQGIGCIERIESTFMDHQKFPFLKYMYAFCYFETGDDMGVEIALKAFKQSKHKYLVVIGDWNSSEKGVNLKNKYAGYANIFMLHFLQNQRQLDLIRSNAILYLHTSCSYDKSDLMLESMSLKLPVLAFECVGNKFLTEGNAIYFKNSADIEYHLRNVNMEKLRWNALAMHDIVLRRFDWDNVVLKYQYVFDELSSNYCQTKLEYTFQKLQHFFSSSFYFGNKLRVSLTRSILNFFL